MQNSDVQRFGQILEALTEAFTPGGKPSTIRSEVYFKGLEDMPIEAVEASAWHLIRTRKTASFPKVGEIREARQGNIEDQAIIAVDRIDHAIRTVGNYQSVQFDDPLIHSVVQALGGWIRLGQVSEEEWKWMRKDAVRLYRAFAADGERTPDKTLVGIIEQANQYFPEYVCAPVQIGQQKRGMQKLLSPEDKI